MQYNDSLQNKTTVIVTSNSQKTYDSSYILPGFVTTAPIR